jgi:hypothetical protein
VHDDNVALAHFTNIAKYLRPIEMNVFAVDAKDGYPAMTRFIEAGAEQKMDIHTLGSQLPSVIKTDRSRTDDGDFADG